MKRLKRIIIVLFALFAAASAEVVTIGQRPSFSTCSDWNSFREVKCFKLFTDQKPKSFDDAESFCKQKNATLPMIRSADEQDHLSQLVFTNPSVTTVWLGARFRRNQNFTLITLNMPRRIQWIDHSDLTFTNWATGNPVNKPGRDCVQMNKEVEAEHMDFDDAASSFDDSGYEDQDEDHVTVEPKPANTGKWTDEFCRKPAAVVCQKMVVMSVSRLQKVIIDTRNEVVDLREQLINARKELGKNKRLLMKTSVEFGETKLKLGNVTEELLNTKLKLENDEAVDRMAKNQLLVVIKRFENSTKNLRNKFKTIKKNIDRLSAKISEFQSLNNSPIRK